MQLSKRTRLAVLVGAVTLTGVGGVAYAGIPGSDGVITGCRVTTTGALRVVDAEAGQACKATEKKLAWNTAGRGLTPRGTWNMQTTFKPGDVVSSEGTSYIARTTNTNVKPPNAANWQVSAAKGDPGAQGPAGQQGPVGPAGPGIRGVQQVNNEVKVAWDGTTSGDTVWEGTATCPAGTLLLSGGMVSPNRGQGQAGPGPQEGLLYANTTMVDSYPSVKPLANPPVQEWVVHFTTYRKSPLTVTVTATCANLG